MKEMLMNSNPALSEILFEYCKFLEFNTISDTTRSFDYIFDIIDYFNISDKFLRTVQFHSNSENNGVYIRSDKKIILNIAKLEAAYKLNFLSKEQFIIDYFSLLLHEINHVLQCRYRENIDDGISHILNVSDFLKTNFKNNVRMYHDFFPDEIDSILSLSMERPVLDFSSTKISAKSAPVAKPAFKTSNAIDLDIISIPSNACIISHLM